jgi:NADPH:quinone reductase-like Zn-dependent oxidoreductase
MDMLRNLGADIVVDYTKDDLSKMEETFDVVFDLVGKISFSRTMRSLKKDGKLILGNPGFILPKLFGLWAAVSGNRKVMSNQATGTNDDLEHLKDIIASGKIKVVFDRSFPLEMTADAHRYIEKGLKKGNVAITVTHVGSDQH